MARPDPTARHGRNLLPVIRELLVHAGLSPASIDFLAVGVGPGSYTGLRVALTAAKVLAYALDRPFAGFDSLEAIAWNAPAEAMRISVVADAQRGDVFAADFSRPLAHALGHSEPLVCLRPSRVVPLSVWAEGLESETWVLGPALENPSIREWVTCRARLKGESPLCLRLVDAGNPAHWPNGASLVRLAESLWRTGRRDQLGEIEPRYLRRSAAEDQWVPKELRSMKPGTTTSERSSSDTIDQARTKAAYGLQWNRYRIIRPEEDRATFRNRTGLTPADLAGAVVLDAGCGMGRYLRVAAEQGARLSIGLDLSASVEAARDLTMGSGLSQVALVRGDLLRPPLAPGSFDHVYALGVLDHTPDPRRAFLALARLLKPGGRIAIWVYPRERPMLEWIMRAQRAVSTRLPLGVLLTLSRLSAPVGAWKRRWMSSPNRLIARSAVALNVLTIGVSMHPDPEVRVCDTLDWYAPRYLSWHDRDEILGWFAEAGLVEVVDLSQNQRYFHAGQGNGINFAGRRSKS